MTHSEILSGMRVLITRPVQLSENLALAVRNFGGHTVNFPLLEIDTITEESRVNLLKYAIKRLDDYDILIDAISEDLVHRQTANPNATNSEFDGYR